MKKSNKLILFTIILAIILLVGCSTQEANSIISTNSAITDTFYEIPTDTVTEISTETVTETYPPYLTPVHQSCDYCGRGAWFIGEVITTTDTNITVEIFGSEGCLHYYTDDYGQPGTYTIGNEYIVNNSKESVMKGDLVRILYIGGVLESYPPRLSGVCAVEKLCGGYYELDEWWFDAEVKSIDSEFIVSPIGYVPANIDKDEGLLVSLTTEQEQSLIFFLKEGSTVRITYNPKNLDYKKSPAHLSSVYSIEMVR